MGAWLRTGGKEEGPPDRIYSHKKLQSLPGLQPRREEAEGNKILGPLHLPMSVQWLPLGIGGGTWGSAHAAGCSSWSRGWIWDEDQRNLHVCLSHNWHLVLLLRHSIVRKPLWSDRIPLLGWPLPVHYVATPTALHIHFLCLECFSSQPRPLTSGKLPFTLNPSWNIFFPLNFPWSPPPPKVIHSLFCYQYTSKLWYVTY